jgi:CheY-like chemotaxis protein
MERKLSSWYRIEVPNLIIMDLSMPRVNGFDATRLIRQATPKSAVIIIALTCLGGLEIRQKALAAGCNDHFQKPVGMAELSLLLAQHRVAR